MPDDAEAPVNLADVRRAAMDLLARREHSRHELEQKLARRFPQADIVNAQLDQLAEENLQSDARYAESFVRQRFDRGHGPLRIRQEMRQRGISERDAEHALNSEDYDWRANAERVWNRKFGLGPADDIRESARRSRFMQYRGFSVEHFRSLIGD